MGKMEDSIVNWFLSDNCEFKPFKGSYHTLEYIENICASNWEFTNIEMLINKNVHSIRYFVKVLLGEYCYLGFTGVYFSKVDKNIVVIKNASPDVCYYIELPDDIVGYIAKSRFTKS